MRAVASYVLRGKAQAVLVACGFGVLSLILPPFSWPAAFFSGAALSLVILVKGPKEGIQTAILAVIAILALTGIAAKVPMLGMVYATMLWLPALLLAELIRQQRSLAVALSGALILAFIVLLGVYVLMDNPAQWWQQLIEQQVIPMLKEAGLSGPQLPSGKKELTAMASVMTGTLLSFWLLSLCLIVILSRWWQALIMKRPEAYREEFYQLRFGTLVAGIALLSVAGAFLAGGWLSELLRNLSILMLVIFLFQGLSVMHQRLMRQKNARLWLVVMYVLLVLTLPYLLLAIALTGWLDNWLNLRGRGANKPAA